MSSNVTRAHLRLVRTANDLADARSLAALTGRAVAALAVITAAVPEDGGGGEAFADVRAEGVPAVRGALDGSGAPGADTFGDTVVASGADDAVVAHSLPKSTPSGPTVRSSVTAIPAIWRFRHGSGGGCAAHACGAAKTNSDAATPSNLRAEFTSGVPARTGTRRAPPRLPR